MTESRHNLINVKLLGRTFTFRKVLHPVFALRGADRMEKHRPPITKAIECGETNLREKQITFKPANNPTAG